MQGLFDVPFCKLLLLLLLLPPSLCQQSLAGL
jgi:hypothetical protein